MGIEIDPVDEIYSRYPYPPADAVGRGWKRRYRSKIEEGRDIARALAAVDPGVVRGRILDAGCGTGLKLLGMAEALPYATFVGLDLSRSSLASARRILTDGACGNATLCWGNLAEGLPPTLEGPFDALVCDGVLHHMKDPAQGLRTLREVLRDGAHAWITVFGKHGRAEMGRVRSMLNILEPRFLFFDQRLETARVLLKATGLARKKHHARMLSDDAFLADSMLNPRETWFDLVSARQMVEGAGFSLLSWVDGERSWRRLAKSFHNAGIAAEILEGALSYVERMRLVELMTCPGMLRLLCRFGDGSGAPPPQAT